jgi:catechol 2,3-dioxygenase-like lactoylglutathione lyase family enzyme
MKLQELRPILWTKSIDKTVSFYTTVLGFSCRSNFPDFASLYRDDIEIMIVIPTEEPDDCKAPDAEEFFRKPLLTGSLYIDVDDVDSLWQQVKDHARIITSLADRDYLMRDFSIADNNGYELVFGQDISARG